MEYVTAEHISVKLALDSIEAGGGVPYHFCGVLQITDTGVASIQGGDMSLVSSHGEADSGVHTVFLLQVTRKRERRIQDGTLWWKGPRVL